MTSICGSAILAAIAICGRDVMSALSVDGIPRSELMLAPNGDSLDAAGLEHLHVLVRCMLTADAATGSPNTRFSKEVRARPQEAL
jgi:hypothetical protein